MTKSQLSFNPKRALIMLVSILSVLGLGYLIWSPGKAVRDGRHDLLRCRVDHGNRRTGSAGDPDASVEGDGHGLRLVRDRDLRNAHVRIGIDKQNHLRNQGPPLPQKCLRRRAQT